MASEYDLAVSFAGENRELARFVANSLREEYRVFFDEFEQAYLWGRDLSNALPSAYLSSRFCMLLLSPTYLERMWTTLERQEIIAEFLRRKGDDFILPVRVDGFRGKLPGLSDLTGYLSIDSAEDRERLVELTRARLDRNGSGILRLAPT